MTQHAELIEFVLEHAMNEPPAKRSRLYRAVARIAGDPAEAVSLTEMADAIDHADSLCREFMFRFTKKLSDPASNL